MKVLLYLLAVVCLIAAAMYCFMPASTLPSFMPGYEASSDHVHLKHAIAAFIVAVVLFVIALWAGRTRRVAPRL